MARIESLLERIEAKIGGPSVIIDDASNVSRFLEYLRREEMLRGG